MSFLLSEIIHIVISVDELLSMSEREYSINSSAGYDIEDDGEYEFIKFTFPLKNGVTHIKLYDSVGIITYENKSGEILKTVEFNDRKVSVMNGSFKKGFKEIREFDRQQPNTTANSSSTQIDRASFGLVEVN
jgi:hypothetical protein